MGQLRPCVACSWVLIFPGCPRQHMGPKAVVQSLSLLLILMRQIIKDVIELHGSQTENLKYFEWSLEYNRIN